MFAALEPMQPVPNPTHYPWTPARPSPLSPRRQSSAATATTPWMTPITQPQFQSPTYPSLFTFTPSPSPSNNKNSFNIDTNAQTTSPSTLPNFNTNANATITSPTPTTQNGKSTYATRYTNTISNPLNKRPLTSSSSPGARSVRRNAFLNRVKADRDVGRFEARSEHLAYIEGVAENKEYYEGMRRGAEEVEVMEGKEGFEDADDADILALDEYIAQERAAEMELLAQMEGADAHAQAQGDQAATASFSDDEYDDIFMDLADHSQGQPQSGRDMDMDMSG
ncbi:uncharacterized protein BDV14DRAFT_195627 [Aspergillus stella-maris]|uniref:uncharacterized protein n=1 Tax=Aspergillus stella-maris TaxID=1810926 RepID=UPI003CCE2BA0